MTIWILAILLIAAFGAIGYVKGAIRMSFPLAGLILGVMLAVPLSPMVRPLVPLMGMKNPIWSWLMPPVIVFFVISLVFVIIGFLVHRQVALHFKYRTDDYQRLSWERLNKRLGICVGLTAGVGYTLLIGLVIYVLGYTTVQVSARDNDPAIIQYLNKARADLQSSGLERTVSRFDPAPKSYYLASDILGLLYHNPLLQGRLASYPAFLSLSERQEFVDAGTDTEFQNLFATQASVGQVIHHPRAQAILGNQEILDQVQQADLADLLEHLKTGTSPRYADQTILGRWQLDPYSTLLQMKKVKTRITTAEMRLMRQQLDFMKSYTLVATPENTVKLKGPNVQPLIEKYMGDLTRAFAQASTRRPPATVIQTPPPNEAAPSAISSQVAERYGLNRPGGTAPPAAVTTVVPAQPANAPVSPAAIAAEMASLPTVVLAQGTWKGDDPKYQLSMEAQADGYKFEQGSTSATVNGVIRDGRLYLVDRDQTIVMARY